MPAVTPARGLPRARPTPRMATTPSVLRNAIEADPLPASKRVNRRQKVRSAIGAHHVPHGGSVGCASRTVFFWSSPPAQLHLHPLPQPERRRPLDRHLDDEHSRVLRLAWVLRLEAARAD